MTSRSGCYQVETEAAHVIFTTADGENTATFHVDQGELRLVDQRGPIAYERSELGAWYDIDHIDYREPEPPE